MSSDLLLISASQLKRLGEQISSDDALAAFVDRVWAHAVKDVERYAASKLTERQFRAQNLTDRLQSVLKIFFEAGTSTSRPLREVPERAKALEVLDQRPVTAELRSWLSNPERQSGNAEGIIPNEETGAGVSRGEVTVGDAVARINELIYRQHVRSVTCTCGVVCIGTEPPLQSIEGQAWESAVTDVLEKTEEKPKKGGPILEAYRRLVSLDGDGEEGAKEQIKGLTFKLQRATLQKRVRKDRSFRSDLREIYRRARDLDQSHLRAEEDLRRLNERELPPLQDALLLLQTYEAIRPGWKGEAERVLQALKNTSVGGQLLAQGAELGDAEDAFGEGPSIGELKETLRENIEELKLHAGVKYLQDRLAEKSRTLPPWEQARESFGLPPLPSGGTKERVLEKVENVIEQMKKAVEEGQDLSELTSDKVGENVSEVEEISFAEILRQAIGELEDISFESGRRAFYRYLDAVEEATEKRPDTPEELLELLR